MISSKVIDAVIAVSNAQHDVATNSKQFQDNLKKLSAKHTELKKVVATIKASQKELSESAAEVAESEKAILSGEARLAAAVQTLAGERAVVVTEKTYNAEMDTWLKSQEKEFSAQQATLKTEKTTFDRFYKAKSKELASREDNVTEREAKVAKITAAINA